MKTSRYDATGHLVATTDPANFTTSYAYDAAGRRVATTDALGNTVSIDYDAAGRVVAESGATYPVRKSYDAYGRWTSLQTTRDGSTWDETKWTYDEATGVQTAKTYADGSVVLYDYDEDGRPTRTTWARGAWFENHYDEWGQIVAVTHDDPTIDVAMAYDDFGRLVTASNNVAVYRYTYDNRGLVTNEVAVISGVTNMIVRDFDDYGRPSRLRIADSDYDQTYAYDSAGRLSVIGIPGSTVTYAYTPDSLDAGYSVLTPSNAVLTRALTRDPLRRGLILSVSNLVNGVDSGSSFDYTYDALGHPVTRNLDEFGYNVRGEIVRASYGTNTLADIYDYDNIGNFTSNRLRGVWSQFVANELNEYASIANLSTPSTMTLAYDPDGNLLTNGVWSYCYDSMNRLSAVCSNGIFVTTYCFDAFSRRVYANMRDHSNVVFFDYRSIVRMITEQGLDTSERVADFFWGNDVSGLINGIGGIGGLICANTTTTMYPSFDVSGNIVAWNDCSGNIQESASYGVFGLSDHQVSGEPTVPPFGFSSRLMDCQDDDVLYDYGLRVFSPGIGRWINRDPSNEHGSMNLYAMCNNNPVYSIDMFGNDFVKIYKFVGRIGKLSTKAATILCTYTTVSSILGDLYEWAFQTRTATIDVTCPANCARRKLSRKRIRRIHRESLDLDIILGTNTRRFCQVWGDSRYTNRQDIDEYGCCCDDFFWSYTTPWETVGPSQKTLQQWELSFLESDTDGIIRIHYSNEDTETITLRQRNCKIKCPHLTRWIEYSDFPGTYPYGDE